MLALTPQATEKIKRILAQPSLPDSAGLRIAPTDERRRRGRRALEVSLAQSPDPQDEVVDDDGARVFVDSAVSDALDGKVLDATMVEQRVSFSVAPQQA